MPDNINLINAIDAAESNAVGEDSEELSTHRSLALDAYAGKNLEPNDEGRSQVLTSIGIEG